MAMNGLYLPANAPWVPSFRRELLLFPAGSHDDQVDALGLIGQMLDLITPGRVPEPPKRRIPDELIYEVRDGRLVANMSVFEWVEMKRSRKALDA